MSIRNLSVHLSVYWNTMSKRLAEALLFPLTQKFFYFNFLLYEEGFSVPAVPAYQRKNLVNSWLFRIQYGNQNRIAINRATSEQNQSKMNTMF